MYEHNLWGMLPDHLTRHMNDKVILFGPFHEVFPAAMLIPFRKIFCIRLDNIKHFRAGSRIRKTAAQSISFLRHPIFCHQPVHIRMVGSSRPGYGTRCISRSFRRMEYIIHFIATTPTPVLFFICCREGEIAGNSMGSRVTSRKHGNMCRIRDGRVDGPHSFCHTASFRQVFFAIRKLQQLFQILAHKSIHGKY